MIFVTIGFQLPFDRLIQAMDNIAGHLNGVPVVAQVSEQSKYVVKNMTTIGFIPPSEIGSYFAKAEVIVSHAGIGTIISALEIGKPIIVMPRLAKYNEVTTDHQLATIKKFEKNRYIYTAFDENELQKKIELCLNGTLKPGNRISKFASGQLIESINSFLTT